MSQAVLTWSALLQSHFHFPSWHNHTPHPMATVQILVFSVGTAVSLHGTCECSFDRLLRVEFEGV